MVTSQRLLGSGTDSTEPIKKYGYVYDGLNRLTPGFYYKKSGTSYLLAEENNEIPEYDLNGNILKLKRFAYLVGTTPNKIDDLAYTYTGNRLTNLSDAENLVVMKMQALLRFNMMPMAI